MSKRPGIWTFVVLLLALSAAWGQDDAAQQPEYVPPVTNPQQPTLPSGMDNITPSISENPPISGVDLPSVGPHAAPLSYLQAGGHLSETVDSNIQNALGGSNTSTISVALGSLELQRLWSNYDLALDYLGGAGYYYGTGLGLKQIEELGANQKVTWKRGQFAIRDAFSYQPEGTFGSGYSGVASTGAGLSGTSTFTAGTALGALGQVPRIMNLSSLDLVETLTPKSSITVTGQYGFVHFLENELGTGNSFIGNSQVTGEAGYNRVLGPHDQGALAYAYQQFRFSTGLSLRSHVIQFMWGHRISGRMDFKVSVGPQFTQIGGLLLPAAFTVQNMDNPSCVLGFSSQGPEIECPTSDLRISAAGRAILRYRFTRANLDASYSHFLSNGSGFFAGAESDIALLSLNRPLGRIWTTHFDIGYSRNSRELPLTPSQLAGCTAAAQGQPNAPSCSGVSANVYQYGYAGVGVHRMFGRNLRAFANFQFNDLVFDSSYCQGIEGPCNRTSARSLGTIGLDWIPRPMRLE